MIFFFFIVLTYCESLLFRCNNSDDNKRNSQVFHNCAAAAAPSKNLKWRQLKWLRVIRELRSRSVQKQNNKKHWVRAKWVRLSLLAHITISFNLNIWFKLMKKLSNKANFEEPSTCVPSFIVKWEHESSILSMRAPYLWHISQCALPRFSDYFRTLCIFYKQQEIIDTMGLTSVSSRSQQKII